MEINPIDYISETEIKKIVKEQIIDYIKKERERIFYNAVSRFLTEYMNDSVNDEMKKTLIEKTEKAITEKNLAYELFKRPDAWDRSEQACWRILQSASNKHREVLEERVKEVFSNLDEHAISMHIESVTNKLFVKLLTD